VTRVDGPLGQRRRALSSEVADLLLTAQAIEKAETGAQRNAAFRRTRALITGARRAGISMQELADCLGVTVGTLRTRADSDEWISEADFALVSGVSAEVLRRWRRAGRLPHRATGADGCAHFLAHDLIVAFADTHRRNDARK
jgi:DNA-binding transcriptional regulator YiaG